MLKVKNKIFSIFLSLLISFSSIVPMFGSAEDTTDPSEPVDPWFEFDLVGYLDSIDSYLDSQIQSQLQSAYDFNQFSINLAYFLIYSLLYIPHGYSGANPFPSSSLKNLSYYPVVFLGNHTGSTFYSTALFVSGSGTLSVPGGHSNRVQFLCVYASDFNASSVDYNNTFFSSSVSDTSYSRILTCTSSQYFRASYDSSYTHYPTFGYGYDYVRISASKDNIKSLSIPIDSCSLYLDSEHSFPAFTPSSINSPDDVQNLVDSVLDYVETSNPDVVNSPDWKDVPKNTDPTPFFETPEPTFPFPTPKNYYVPFEYPDYENPDDFLSQLPEPSNAVIYPSEPAFIDKINGGLSFWFGNLNNLFSNVSSESGVMIGFLGTLIVCLALVFILI